jgi:quercetin dioxygenase-like cupin family protein
MHIHRHDYVAITLGAADISNAPKGKPSVEVKMQDGDTRFVAAGVVHAVTDLGEQPFRNLTIEFLQDEKLRASPAHWDEERGLDVLSGGTRHVLFVNDGVRVSAFELQPAAVIPKHHHAGPRLVVALTEINLRSDVEGQAPTTTHLNSGEVKWLTGGYSHTVTNTGQNVAKYVSLEFP